MCLTIQPELSKMFSIDLILENLNSLNVSNPNNSNIESMLKQAETLKDDLFNSLNADLQESYLRITDELAFADPEPYTAD